MNVICISGTPGTGKTTIARKFAKILSYKYIDVNSVIKENHLSFGHDKKRRCKIIDVDRLNEKLIDIIKINKSIKSAKKEKNGLVIDSHLSHYLSPKYVDLCVITKCDLKTLEKRLKKRKYPIPKVRENLDSEIFDICYNEALEARHNVAVINTTNNINTQLKQLIKKWQALKQKN